MRLAPATAKRKKAEISVPNKHAQSMPYRGSVRTSADGRFVYLQNATPAQSVSNRFSTLCGDGTMLTVTLDDNGQPVDRQKSDKFFRKLLEFDAVLIAGQAKSHCVAWTIDDLLEDILAQDRKLVEKVYLLEDCTSPVVIPGVIDYTERADAAFRRFAEAGMHIVRATDPIDRWPGIRL